MCGSSIPASVRPARKLARSTLVKLALAAASESEGAVHSHVRRALDEGIDPNTLRHVAILSIPTLGFPKAMATLTWIDDLAQE